MPARDRYHDVVVRALEKDGWIIEREQVMVSLHDDYVLIDIAASHTGVRRILFVEVKTLEGAASLIHVYAHVLGQYLVYRSFLGEHYGQALYLGVTQGDYARISSSAALVQVSMAYNLQWIVCDIAWEVIVQWIHSPQH